MQAAVKVTVARKQREEAWKQREQTWKQREKAFDRRDGASYSASI